MRFALSLSFGVLLASVACALLGMRALAAAEDVTAALWFLPAVLGLVAAYKLNREPPGPRVRRSRSKRAA
jgi:hypothetical protein